MEAMACRQRHPSTIFKMKNGVCLASDGVFAYKIAAEKTLKYILPTSKPQAIDSLWKIKMSPEVFPSQSISLN